MIYPQNFESKIGFDKIKQLLTELCLSTMGETLVAQLNFEHDFGLINQKLSQVSEMKELITIGEGFPQSNYYDLTPVFERIGIEGTFIEVEELFDFKGSLQTIIQIIHNVKHQEEGTFLELRSLLEEVYIEPFIPKAIERIIDDKGQIKDTASEKLYEIRKAIEKHTRSIQNNLQRILKEAKKQSLVSSETELVLRNGRNVIPVSASHKRSIKGYIHDESATGQTVFVEPAEIFEMNNELLELENAQRREIIRILIDFTDSVRPFLEELSKAYLFLGNIDFILAKAKLAIELNAFKPIINQSKELKLINARHPLLVLSLKNTDRKVVPLSIEINDNQRIIIISGPNAGGKSVCMTTVALIQYMLQCGILVPVEPFSELGIFDNMFINIGDEQSLENDLSTYSSFLRNMKHFIDGANENTLFFIDEMGSGTEPSIGGAIAEALLIQLNNANAKGIITTHYTNLKVLADRTEGITNGAMNYDIKKLTPLFNLTIGKPGSSFAFEIAQNIGLQSEIIQNAMKIVGEKQVSFDKQLLTLEQEKNEIIQKNKTLNIADQLLNETIDKYNKLYSELEVMRKDIINQAKKEALNIIESANKNIEATIRGIIESKAEKSTTKELRNQLEQEKEKLKTEVVKIKKPKTKTIITEKSENIPQIPLKIGDTVGIKGQQQSGELIEIKGNNALIIANGIKIKTKLDDLEKRSPKNNEKKQKGTSFNFDLNSKAGNFNLKLDLRGKKAEEAMIETNRFIDEASLLSIREVKILHGKGNGILRNVVRQTLSENKLVKHFQDEHVEFGGQGITVITLL